MIFIFSNVDYHISKGSLKTKQCPKSQLHMVNYNKDAMFDVDDDFSSKFRSVIFTKDLERVMCFSPPKSCSLSDLTKALHTDKLDEDQIIAEEIIEGTMINLFYDTENGCWEVATKNRIRAENMFFRDKTGDGKTFREMFMETMKFTNLDLVTLDKHYCYSFVMQHPDNNIIKFVEHPRLFLVAVFLCSYDFNAKTNIISSVDVGEIRKTNMFDQCNVQYPRRFENWRDLDTLFKDWCLFFPEKDFAYVPGIMLFSKDGSQRSKYRNPKYEYLRILRGNQPKLQYHYLTLRKEYRVLEYLQCFPYHASEFEKFGKEVHDYTLQMVAYYNECFTSADPDGLLQKLVSTRRNYAKYGKQISLLLGKVSEEKKEELEEGEIDANESDEDDDDDDDDDDDSLITYTKMANYLNTLPVKLLMHLINL